MKRMWVSVLVCAIVVFNLVVAGPVKAQQLTAISFSAISFPKFQFAEAAAPAEDLLTKLETEILPQLESILDSKQRENFKASVAEGVSFRKAFKSLTLTPEQKAELKNLLKSLPSKDTFASLTPNQKKQLFLKNKDAFIPTADEISEKISAGMKKKESLIPSSTAVSDKINAALKKKEGFLPTAEEIGTKITEKMKAIESKVEEAIGS